MRVLLNPSSVFSTRVLSTAEGFTEASTSHSAGLGQQPGEVPNGTDSRTSASGCRSVRACKVDREDDPDRVGRNGRRRAVARCRREPAGDRYHDGEQVTTYAHPSAPGAPETDPFEPRTSRDHVDPERRWLRTSRPAVSSPRVADDHATSPDTPCAGQR